LFFNELGVNGIQIGVAAQSVAFDAKKARAFSRGTGLPTQGSSTAVSRNRAGTRGSGKPALLHLMHAARPAMRLPELS